MFAQRISMILPRDLRPVHGVARELASAGFCLLVLTTCGCQPKLDPDKYGEVITELPHVPGIEKPYPLPEFEESPDNAKGDEPARSK